MSQVHEQSITLTGDEVSVLFRLLARRPVPPPAIDVADISRRSRRQRLDAALDEMVQRNVVRDGGAAVATPVAAMIEVLAAPEWSVEIVHDDSWARLAVIDGVAVEERLDGDSRQLTPVAPAEVLTRISRLAGLAGQPQPPGEPLAATVREVSEGSDRLGAPRCQAGVRVRHLGSPNAPRGGEAWWLETDLGLWLLPPTMSFFADSPIRDDDTALWEQASDGPVMVVPVDATSIVASIRELFEPTPDAVPATS